MLYSLKMRAAQGATHEQGGKHISGAERIIHEQDLEQIILNMFRRARGHDRGSADFINIKVGKITDDSIHLHSALQVVPLSLQPNITAAREHAAQLLAQSGVSKSAIQCAFERLATLRTSMRGALLLYAGSGQVVPVSDNNRGIRVSNMDAHCEEEYTQWLNNQNLHGIHAREAIILASKVASCPQVVAELCWSDDPDYTIGYVADSKTYRRIAPLKPMGSDIGGRIFFVEDNADIATIVNYLQNQPVLIEVCDVTTKIDK